MDPKAIETARGRRPQKLPPVPESEVLKGCLKVLESLGVFAWRNNTGAFAGEHKGQRRFVRYGKVGSSDILGVIPSGDRVSSGVAGKLLAVETKRKGNIPSEAQMGFLRRVGASGGIAFWVDDVDVFKSTMERILKGSTVYLDEAGIPWVTDEDRGKN